MSLSALVSQFFQRRIQIYRQIEVTPEQHGFELEGSTYKTMQEEKGTTEDEMIGWQHWLNGHEFELAPPGAGEGQGSLAFCSPWGCKEWDMMERLNLKYTLQKYIICNWLNLRMWNSRYRRPTISYTQIFECTGWAT